MKTAMQELRDELMEIMHRNPHITPYDVVKLIDNKIPKERQQIEDAYNEGTGLAEPSKNWGQDYYTKTYNQ